MEEDSAVDANGIWELIQPLYRESDTTFVELQVSTPFRI